MSPLSFECLLDALKSIAGLGSPTSGSAQARERRLTMSACVLESYYESRVNIMLTKGMDRMLLDEGPCWVKGQTRVSGGLGQAEHAKTKGAWAEH